MGKNTNNSRGFTLIAALLLTVLLSGMAVGLIYMVNNEQRMGGNDLEGRLAYYGAEAAIENLTAQLSTLYSTAQTPSVTAICGLANSTDDPTQITGSNLTATDYQFNQQISWPSTAAPGTPCTSLPNPSISRTWDVVGSGPNQGMVASLTPFNLQVTATRLASAGEVTTNTGLTPTGSSVNLTRTVEVAQLPAFEFGIFCDGDCDYFAGPNFNFGGRVHTNGNLFLATGSSLTFTDKIAAVGQVITTQLENGWPTSNGYGGTTYVPSAASACPGAPGSGPATNCSALPSGSWSGGFPPSGGAIANWKGISTDSPTGSPAGFSSFIITGATGATKLQLPFVGTGTTPNAGAIEIIRRPQLSDSPQLSASRLYGEANIRVLLADTIGDLHPERSATQLDADDVQLGITTTNPSASGTGNTSAPTTSAQLKYNGAPSNSYMSFGIATGGTNGWVAPTNPASPTSTYSWTKWPILGQITTKPANAVGPAPSTFGNNIPYVWLRVEYYNGTNWIGVTRQWLGYGFGRLYDQPPTAPATTAACTAVYPNFPAGNCSNPISPAILILQQLQYQDGSSSGTDSGTGSTAGNWIPINLYDSREGEPRDNGTARASNTTTTNNQTVYTPCSSIGVMNAIELDTGNLWLWLQGLGPYTSGFGSGPLVSQTNANGTNLQGWIVYFSDRRGMLPDTNPPAASLYNHITGNSGLEDTINSSSSTGVPDNTLEPVSYYSYSPEDVDADGYLEKQGETYLGAGFSLTGTYTSMPYFPIPANASTSNTNQVNCSSYRYRPTGQPAGTIWTYPQGTGLAGGVAPPQDPQDNLVTGPRHSLRLVDGGMSGGVSYLPHPISPATYGNGFTVGSEEPVYIYGNYNTGPSDPFWPSENVTTTPHSATAIIADTVTLLSNAPTTGTTSGWTDANSFLQPGSAGNRSGNTSYYRVAIASGKSVPFLEPGWAASLGMKDFGTDGGMHNFLRYLENMGANSSTVNYAGSQISMYFSQYATGVFKCCDMVYEPPNRNYFFDTQFLNPQNLPPGTPMFQDMESLGFHQSFIPQ